MSITLFLMDLKKWFVIGMILCFGCAIAAGLLHSHLRQQQEERERRYERQQHEKIQIDQKKLDNFRY